MFVYSYQHGLFLVSKLLPKKELDQMVRFNLWMNKLYLSAAPVWDHQSRSSNCIFDVAVLIWNDVFESLARDFNSQNSEILLPPSQLLPLSHTSWGKMKGLKLERKKIPEHGEHCPLLSQRYFAMGL